MSAGETFAAASPQPDQALAILRAGGAAADAIVALRAGGTVAIAGTSTEFPEAMLCAAADGISAATLNGMIVQGRGLTCVALPAERCAQLGLRSPRRGTDGPRRVDYLNSVEARVGVTTGISVADRVRTIGLLGDPVARAHDLVAPGHVMPIRVADGGVLAHPGSAEAALDLVTLAGQAPAAALCHVLDEDGEVAGLDALAALAAAHGIPLVSAGEVVDLRLRSEALVQRVGTSVVATAVGELETVSYRQLLTGAAHFAVLVGRVGRGAPPPRVRVLVQDPLAHAIGAAPVLADALGALASGLAGEGDGDGADGGGVLLYLASEGAAPPAWREGGDGQSHATAGSGLNAYAAAQILRDLDVEAVRLG